MINQFCQLTYFLFNFLLFLFCYLRIESIDFICESDLDFSFSSLLILELCSFVLMVSQFFFIFEKHYFIFLFLCFWWIETNCFEAQVLRLPSIISMTCLSLLRSCSMNCDSFMMLLDCSFSEWIFCSYFCSFMFALNMLNALNYFILILRYAKLLSNLSAPTRVYSLCLSIFSRITYCSI